MVAWATGELEGETVPERRKKRTALLWGSEVFTRFIKNIETTIFVKVITYLLFGDEETLGDEPIPDTAAVSRLELESINQRRVEQTRSYLCEVISSAGGVINEM
ncbi:hypothetical protein NDU88_008312 [Pleurodeles waltl]|uniref:Uncharacterized protein n=1 Tax=Pleurodeles waltl TaxID=8319 RepID=A0AAV7U2B5_PLEWA|nr:hypothetical protein NDU88_008312 [Pleurodeles waltl]